MATDPTLPADPGGPPTKAAPPNIELTLAKLANDAMQQHADPQQVTEQLRSHIAWLRANPGEAKLATDALAQGEDPMHVASMVDQRASAPPPERPGILSRVVNDFSQMGSNLIHHPLDTITQSLAAPAQSFANMIAPTEDEAKSLNQPDNPTRQALIARFGEAPTFRGVTGAQRKAGAIQTGANVAAPFVAAIPFVGPPAAAAMVGAAYRPDDPLAGAIEGGAVGTAARPILKGVHSASLRFRPEAAADEAILGAATKSGLTPQSTSDVPVESPTTLMDLAGKGSPLQRLARQAWNVPASAAQQTLGRFLNQRAGGTGQRIVGAVSDATSVTPTDIEQPIEQFIQTRAQQAKPLYEQAYAHGPLKDPETLAQIQTLLKNPIFAKAWARGQNLAQLEEAAPEAAPKGISPADWERLKAQGLDKYVPQANQPATTGPTVQQVDYWKRGLDAQIESGAGSDNALSRTEARTYRQKLNQVLSRVDAEVPAYAEARANFAGNSDLVDAAAAGAEHFSPKSGTAAYLSRTIGERLPTPGEQAAYRTNAINSFVQQVRNLAANPDLPQAARGTNLVQRLLGTEENGAKLRMLFPDDQSYGNFIAKMEQEATYPQTSQFLQNQSSTAAQLAEGGMSPGAWRDLALSPISDFAKARLVERASKSLLGSSTAMRPAVADAVATRLTQTGQPMRDLLPNLTARRAAQIAGRQRLAAILGSGAAVSGRPQGQ